MSPLLRWASEVPALRRPLLIVALEGFVDAGAAASTASTFLRHRWRAEPVATFDGDAFLDYRARRPTAVIDGGRLRRVEWPSVDLLAAVLDGDRDVVLLLGAEPDMAWAAFCKAAVEAARALGVSAVLSLGAYPAAVPHTRPTRLRRAANEIDQSDDADGVLVVDAAAVPGYTGPVNASTALQAAFAQAGVPAVGLWAEVPHYVSASPDPGAALALVRAVSSALGVEVEVTELEAAATAHREQVDEAVAEHAEAAGMVAALEQHVDAGTDEAVAVTGDEIADEVERFLRSQTD